MAQQLTFETFGASDASIALPSLFREARRVEPVLSYEQAQFDQIIPNAEPPSDVPREGLILPGGVGLVLFDAAGEGLGFDWMQWGETAELARSRQELGATVSIDDLSNGARSTRKLARQRCVIPLVRYSVPVREGDVWSHLWVSPAAGQFACAAGIWMTEPGERARFAMVTSGAGLNRPVLLSESDLLSWLRAPLKDAIARITRYVSPQL